MSGLLLLHTEPARRLVLRQAADYLARRGIQLEAARLDYNLLRLTADIQEVAVAAAGAPTLARVRRISLSAGRHGLESMDMEGLAVSLVIGPDGRDNLPRPPSGGASSPAAFSFPRTRISGASLSFEDRFRQIRAQVPNWRLSAAGARLRLETVAPASLAYAGRTVSIPALSLDAFLGRDAVDLRALRVVAEAATVTAHGRVENFTQPVLALDVDARADLAALSRLAEIPRRVGGPLNLRARITGPAGRLRVEGSAASEGLAVETFGPIRLDGRFAYDAGGRRLELSALSIRTPLGAIAGEAAVALDGPSRGSARLENLDLASGSRALALPVAVMSRAEGTVTAEWPGVDLGRATAAARVKLTASQTFPGRDALPVTASLDASLAGGSLALTIESLVTGGIQASGRVALDGWRNLGGELRLEAASLAAAADHASRFLAREIDLGEAGGAALIDARLGGTLESPSVVGRVAITDLHSGLFRGGAFTAHALYGPGRLEMPSAVLEWNGQSLHAQGSLDLKASELDLSARIEEASLDRILAGLGRPDIPISGAVSIAATAAGPLENPRFTLEAAGPAIAIGDTRLAGTVALNAKGQGTIGDPRLHLDLKSIDLRAAGQELGPVVATVDFEQQEARLKLTVPKFGVVGTGRAGLAAPFPAEFQIDTRDTSLEIFPPLKGRLSATVRGAGDAAQWQKGRLGLHVEDLDASWEGCTLRTEGPLEAEFSAGLLTLRPAVLSLAGERVTLEGSLPLEGSGSVRLTAGLDLARLPEVLNRELPIAASGRIALEAVIGGSLLQPIPGVTARIDDLGFSVPGQPLRGTASLRLEAQAPAPALDAVAVQATLEGLRLEAGELRLRQTGAARLNYEKGGAGVDRLELTGAGTRLELTGSAAPEALGLRLKGDLDLALLSLFSSQLRAQGKTQLDVALSGSAAAPKASGYLEFQGGQARLAGAGLRLDDLKGRVHLEGDRLSLAGITAALNGGSLEATGGLRFAARPDVNLTLTGLGVYLNVPQGLNTISDAEITIQSRQDEYVVGGWVVVQEAAYREPLTLERGLLAYLGASPQTAPRQEEPSELLSKVRFQIDVATATPLVVNNNLARAAILADLRLSGAYDRPGVTGRLEVEEGGEIYLSERRFLVDRGVITLTGEQRIEPSLDILARTDVQGYNITLAISGEPGNIQTNLTSEPELAEPSIVTLLVTGRKLEELPGAEVNVASEQALSYLAGSLGASLTSQVQRAFGLSRVRLEPSLISAESNPGARLTVGQEITRQLELVYSMNLANSGDQIWIAEYDITRRFITRGTKQQDNSFRLDVNHNIELGSVSGEMEARARAREVLRIGTVAFRGDSPFSAKELAGQLKVKPGLRYNFFKVRRGLDRLEDAHAARDLLEARVRLSRDPQGSLVNLGVEIEAGPRIEIVYQGWDPPRSLRRQVRQIWRNGVFDAQRLDDAAHAIREHLVRDGFLQASLRHQAAAPQEGRKRVLFEISPGVRFGRVRAAFHGIAAFKSSRLERLFRREALILRPAEVAATISRFYRDQGYLDAEVQAPRAELDAASRTGRVVIDVREGPRFRVGDIEFAGNTAYSAGELARAIPLVSGRGYTPAARDQAAAALRDLYFARGYKDAGLRVAMRKDPAGAVHLRFDISENLQRVVSEVKVAGADRTGEALVRGQLDLAPGDVLSNEKLGRARRALYGTGAYSLVNLEPSPAGDAAARPGRLPVNLSVNLRERKPFALRYGAFYDTERGPGMIADITNRNSLGAARVLGFRSRYDADVHEGRLYFSQPLLRRLPLKTSVVGFARRELRESFLADRAGVSAQQETRLGRHFIVNYGYRFEHTHTYDREPDPLFPFDVTLRVAPLTAALTRETRDDILDATRGSFTSHAFEYGSKALGSQLRFARYFGQYFKYLGLTEPAEIPFSGGQRRPRILYAGGVRLGLAGGLGGQELVPSERFFAGGGTTIRGFKQDSVGPFEFGAPAGGNALFVTNQELRFPLLSIFDGVGFLDLGNVYRRIADFDPSRLRKSAGAGLRVRTPYFLLRLDYGFKVDRKPGEPPGRFFFSIGQAF